MAAARRSWFVYILRCRDGSLYTGATNDLARRLEHHANGKAARYTRSRLPVTLVYEERARDRGAALRREVLLKRLPRVEKLALVAASRLMNVLQEDRCPATLASPRPRTACPTACTARSPKRRG